MIKFFSLSAFTATLISSLKDSAEHCIYNHCYFSTLVPTINVNIDSNSSQEVETRPDFQSSLSAKKTVLLVQQKVGGFSPGNKKCRQQEL